MPVIARSNYPLHLLKVPGLDHTPTPHDRDRSGIHSIPGPLIVVVRARGRRGLNSLAGLGGHHDLEGAIIRKDIVEVHPEF